MTDTETTARTALSAWLWGRKVTDVGALADQLMALPLVERARLVGIELEAERGAVNYSGEAGAPFVPTGAHVTRFVTPWTPEPRG